MACRIGCDLINGALSLPPSQPTTRAARECVSRRWHPAYVAHHRPEPGQAPRLQIQSRGSTAGSDRQQQIFQLG
jgi:hypothetical protein